MTLTQMPKVGDKVRYIDDSLILEVAYHNAWGDAVLRTLDGRPAGELAEEDLEYFELISKGAVVEPPQSTADLIANLARRVYELESTQVTRKDDDKMTEYVAEKRHAKPGERIVVVAPHGLSEREQGDILTVKTVDSCGNVLATDGGHALAPDEYEVLPAEMATAVTSIAISADDISDGWAEYAKSLARGEGDGFGDMTAREMRQAWPTLGPTEDEKRDYYEATASDNVEKPAHYTQGGVETIDYIAQVAGGYSDGFVAHCVGTAIKYLSRAPYKHETPTEDLRKARRYLDFAIERMEGAR